MKHPASRGRADSNQGAIAEAIRLLGFPVMVLSHAGNGVEDLLVAIGGRAPHQARRWLMVECKVGRVRYTARQQTWREQTDGWPRITVTSAQDAVDQIRELTR